jgi:hypothetical protein
MQSLISPKLVVSLTTSPMRLPLIGPTLVSMFRQNPFEVVLNIPNVFSRTQETYMSREQFLECMEKNCPMLLEYVSKLKWNLCGDDLGPITKLHPIMSIIPFEEDCWIVTIDDDIEYLDGILDMFRDTITKRIKDGEKFAMGLTGFRFLQGHRIYPLEANNFAEILEGYGSVCYHRSFFPNRSWGNYVKYVMQEPACKFSDDLIISNWLAMNNIKRLLVSTPWVNRRLMWASKCILDYGNQSDALHNGGAKVLTKDSNVQRYFVAKKMLKRHKLLSAEFYSSQDSFL